MGEDGPVTRALQAIGADVDDDRELAGRICGACVDGLDIDGAAISMHTASTLRETLFAGDATADLLEELQFALGEGACMDAARTGRPVLVPDMTDAHETARWPAYAAAVLEQTGVRAVFALPLQWGTIKLGVLDLYRVAAGSLGRGPLDDVVGASDVAASMLMGLRTDPGDSRFWDDSWGSRAEIHQATGMVVAQLGLDATDAFARIRAHAFAERLPLGEVAAGLVARSLRFDDGTGPQ